MIKNLQRDVKSDVYLPYFTSAQHLADKCNSSCSSDWWISLDGLNLLVGV